MTEIEHVRYKKIQTVDLTFPDGLLSEEAMDLISRMLQARGGLLQATQPGKPNGWLTPPSNAFCSRCFKLRILKRS